MSDRAGWHRATRSKGGFDVTYKPGDTEKSSARPCPWLARRKHLHYLKGTIRCGTCSCRLVYSRNKGNGGIYEYFVCPRKQRGECPQGYQPDDLVEAAVEDYYAGVPFSETEREEIRKAISKDLGERVAAAQQEIDCCQGVLKAVKEEERKLLNMHYEDRISAELFDDEQVRLRAQREDAEALTARLNLRYDDIVATFELALEILDEDLQDLYLRADDTIRGLINQAIFNAPFVCDETIVAAELAGPFAELHALHSAIRGIATTPIPAAVEIVPTTAARHGEAPVPWLEREPLAIGSISEVMVELGDSNPRPPGCDLDPALSAACGCSRL